MNRYFFTGRSTARQHHAPPALRAICMPGTTVLIGQSASRLHGSLPGRNQRATLKAISLGICPPVLSGIFNTAENTIKGKTV